MSLLSEFPLRQKIFLSITIVAGLFILLAYNTSIMSMASLNNIICFYNIGVPMLLLCLNTLIDLDKKNVFAAWLVIGLIFLVAYFITKGNPDFITRRSIKFNTHGINKYISGNWTNSFKSLPVFLAVYFLLNFFVKKKTGNFIINTFRQTRWYNDTAGRKIYWYDVIANITLLVIIIITSLF